MPTLRPCSSCGRHVAVESESCPFCTAPLALDRSEDAMPGRVKRAVRFAAITAVAVACGGTGDDTKDATTDATQDRTTADSTVDGSGMDASNDGTMDSGSDANDAAEEDSGLALPYGAPPHDGLKKRFV